MTILDELEAKDKIKSNALSDSVRDKVLYAAKDYKTSWVTLGRLLYAIWEDKLFHQWGFEKFEVYLQKELGLNKQLSMRLLKSYIFIEQDEPSYLNKDFKETREANQVPGYDALNLLRLAKNKKELLKEDYKKLKYDIFEKGKDASVVRKDLVALMKERKPIDPEEERDQRNAAAIKKLLNSLRAFNKDMEALKLVPKDVVEQADELTKALEEQI